mmetsp:Transcript_56488/g.156183  ORF Transcript_56488/g.156183 Transcript_56488/m.156183 type:complete len:159 (+) Transcript_56488:1506-1982(+)
MASQDIHVHICHVVESTSAARLVSRIEASVVDQGLAQTVQVTAADGATREAVEAANFVVAVVTGPDEGCVPFFADERCMREVEWALEAHIPVQPVIHTVNESNIGALLSLNNNTKPNITEKLAGVQWLALEDHDPEYWAVGITKLGSQLGRAMRNGGY